MSTDSLHTRVTSAIWYAERLEEERASSAPSAWVDVSNLEEELASSFSASQPEGRIARRGAVRAALKARDFTRAQALAQCYLADQEVPRSPRATLLEMLEEDARSR